MSIAAYSIGEDALSDGRSLQPLSDAGDTGSVPAAVVQKDVDQSWIDEARPAVFKGIDE